MLEFNFSIRLDTFSKKFQFDSTLFESSTRLELEYSTRRDQSTQTRLQKEVKDKNVIIRHLEAASSQQSTLISEDWFSKLIKLLNSLLFEDSSQNVDNWLSRMRNKLKINKNHFSIEELKIAYIKSWVSEAAVKHIASCMQDIFLNSFLEVEEVLSMINKMYDDLNHHHMTQR